MSEKIRIEVATQADLDKAIADGNLPILTGSGWFRVGGSSHVEARESSHVEAWGSSHVEARGSSHVVAWGSSHVEAWGSSHVVARESSHVEAAKFAAIRMASSRASVTGGIQIPMPEIKNAEDWCAVYGVPVIDGKAVVYKAVRADFRSAKGGVYLPGTSPEATDWDGGEKECGGGLHFSPHPAMALEFDSEATRFLACPVALEDIRAPQESDSYPRKIKARRVAGPIVEVDRYGKPVAIPEPVSA